MVDATAHLVLRSLARLKDAIVADGGQYERTSAAIDRLELAIETELKTENTLPRRGRTGKRFNISQWRRRCYYFQSQFRKVRHALEEMKAQPGRLVHNHWLVRAGLSDPSLSLRSVEESCREFNIHDVSGLSHTSVSVFRDAFCEVLKQMQARDAAAFAAQTRGFLIMAHFHDEAVMRVRSHADTGLLARGRHSKIQNNVIKLRRGPLDEDALTYAVELQPLLRKDAASLATAIDRVRTEVIASAALPPGTRLVHVVVGDGIFSNEAALELLWSEQGGANSEQMVYRMFPVTCASHSANLCTRTAIMGGEETTKASRDPICLTCVRLYKYLFSDYAEEYALLLRDHVGHVLSESMCVIFALLRLPGARCLACAFVCTCCVRCSSSKQTEHGGNGCKRCVPHTRLFARRSRAPGTC